MKKQEWSFSMAQVGVTIENDIFSLKRGGKLEKYPLRSVKGIKFNKSGGLVLPNLMIDFTVLIAEGDNPMLQVVNNKNNRQIIEEVNLALNTYHHQLTTPALNSPSLADELVKLAALKQQGILTDTEFETAKQKLLSNS
jgi:hypothetical protein